MAERLELAPNGSVGPTGRSYWVVEGRFAAGAYPGKKGREELDQIPEVTVKVLSVDLERKRIALSMRREPKED